LDIIHTQIDRSRNEMSLKYFNKSFDELFMHNERSKVTLHFPKRIIEWTEEEKRLNSLIKASSRY
ncbi:MAG: hypothetical protein R3321_13090, partial [Nitrososphaeraceae archaeon]|nr:hypothetical protein [Nitrososphaeraceae archaeon]